MHWRVSQDHLGQKAHLLWGENAKRNMQEAEMYNGHLICAKFGPASEKRSYFGTEIVVQKQKFLSNHACL